MTDVVPTLRQYRIPARWFVWLGAGLLAAGVLTVFGPAIHGEFLIWDDNINIFENPHMGGLSWERMAWAFTDSSQSLRYMPLGWMGYSLVFSLGGLDPTCYHAASILVHMANAVLLYLVLRELLQITDCRVEAGWRESGAWFAAACWAFHPLRVEVVAWALTLTYEMAWFALLAALGCYLKSLATGRAGWMVGAVGSYTISLLAYPVGVTGWLAFLILGAWLARQYGEVVRPRWRSQLPLLAIPGLVALGIALWIRWHVAGPWQAPTDLNQFRIWERAAQGTYAWAYYLWRPWYPVNPSPIYGSLLEIQPLAGRFLLSGAVVAAGSLAAWCRRRTWPGFSAWWWATAAVSLPVMGLTEHPFFTSDRFTGLPGIVLAAGLAILWVRVSRTTSRWLAVGAGGALVAGCVMISWQQVPRWNNTDRLFAYVATTTSDPAVRAECHLRHALVAEVSGRYPDARRECDLGLALAPYQRNLRALSDRLDAPRPAVPPSASTQIKLARFALNDGDALAAEAHLRRAIRLAPGVQEPRIRLAFLLLVRGEPREALRHYLWVGGSGSKELDHRFLTELAAAARRCGDQRLAQAASARR